MRRREGGGQPFTSQGFCAQKKSHDPRQPVEIEEGWGVSVRFWREDFWWEHWLESWKVKGAFTSDKLEIEELEFLVTIALRIVFPCFFPKCQLCVQKLTLFWYLSQRLFIYLFTVVLFQLSHWLLAFYHSPQAGWATHTQSFCLFSPSVFRQGWEFFSSITS